MADVNLFLFRTQAAKDEKAKGKGLGYLMRNEVQLDIKLVVDDDNLYKLVTEIKNLPEEVLQFPGLCSSPIKAGAATVGHLILFNKKQVMFEFLVSPEARQLGHLQFFDQSVTVTTGNTKHQQAVGNGRIGAHSPGDLRYGDEEGKCEGLKILLSEKEHETKWLQKQLAEAKAAVTESKAKLVKEVKERESVEKQLEEIHQLSLSFSSSFLE